MQLRKDGYALAAGEGQNWWFFNSHASVKAGGDETRGAFTLVELMCPPSFGPPPHVHEREDEAFYVLEGRMTVTCGHQAWIAEPGTLVFLPRTVVHAFRTFDEAPVRMLQLTAPAQFEHFVADLGVPAPERRLPDPMPIDMDRVLAVADAHDIRFVLDQT
jgi:mannose-6-phosphate isomerase-like protein (cupin superfamily)